MSTYNTQFVRSELPPYNMQTIHWKHAVTTIAALTDNIATNKNIQTPSTKIVAHQQPNKSLHEHDILLYSHAISLILLHHTLIPLGTSYFPKDYPTSLQDLSASNPSAFPDLIPAFRCYAEDSHCQPSAIHRRIHHDSARKVLQS